MKMGMYGGDSQKPSSNGFKTCNIFYSECIYILIVDLICHIGIIYPNNVVIYQERTSAVESIPGSL
jgi:hypothetical protein